MIIYAKMICDEICVKINTPHKLEHNAMFNSNTLRLHHVQGPKRRHRWCLELWTLRMKSAFHSCSKA